MSSDPEDYTRAFWSRRQVQKFNKARSGVFQGCHSVPLQTEETEPKKQNPSTRERSSTELRFASFPRSIVKDPGRLSRVKMNALRAPLTASQDLTVACANFLLDEANDFIDECSIDLFPSLSINGLLLPSERKSTVKCRSCARRERNDRRRSRA